MGGRMALVGMTPQETVQAAETAITFWVDQKSYEFQKKSQCYVDFTERHHRIEQLVKERLKEAEESCNEMEAEQRELQLKIDSVERETSKVGEEAANLQRQLSEAEHQYGLLLKRISGDQRQEFFRRPLLAESSPAEFGYLSKSSERIGAKVPDRSVRANVAPRHGEVPATSDGRSVRQHSTFRVDALRSPGPLGIEERGPRDSASRGGLPHGLSASRMPSLTPGFLGAGRVTKRRIS